MKLLPALACSAPLAFAAALGLGLCTDLPRQAAVHLAFALGAMPLIFGAMAHFVPVLSRSAAPPRGIRLLPVAAWMGGLGVVTTFLLPGAWLRGPSLAALPPLLAAAIMLGWVLRRGRGGLGAPHPGLWWYAAACACLMAALLAVPAMEVWPAARAALRLVHLHLNTLGFIGLSAVGTLQVLLPTAVGRADALAAMRLRRDLRWAFVGVVLIAAGAASAPAVTILGLLFWLWPLCRLGLAWWRNFRPEILCRHGAAPALAWALVGLLGLSLLGGLHGSGVVAGVDAIVGFFLVFLLPLVTGALSQLLPVWFRPGPRTPWHQVTGRRLQRHGGLRGAAFCSAGLAYALDWHALALLVLPPLAQFLWTLAALARESLPKLHH